MTQNAAGGVQTFDWEAILRILPHRYPFLMIDKVESLELGKRVVCIKNVSFNEPQFQGHFPSNPVMPGVLIAEALAQASAFLLIGNPDCEGKLAVLASIEDAKFRRMVRPGDQLRLEAEALRLRSQFGKAKGKATVDGELVADMTIMFGLVSPTPPSGGR